MNRDESLARLADRSERFDVIVIGGGATGLGCSVDAAARGYRTVLVEQSDFAKAFCIPLATLRDWEHRRHEPDQAALAYLRVIAREPDAVRRALAARTAADA